MTGLEGKVAIVTGGTRGIGRAVAAALAREGARVTLTGRDAGRAKEEAESLSVFGVALDVAHRASVDAAFESVLNRDGRLDILVNNAGIARDNLLLRMKPDDWSEVLATNLTGLFYCCQVAMRPMIRQRYGRIVNMSSVVGLMGSAGQVNYAATKAGIIGFSKSLAKEVASRDVTVNVVAPGFIETEMTEGLTAEAKAVLIADTPLGRMGTPEDVAAAVLFLVSPGANYITGQVLSVNGGMYM